MKTRTEYVVLYTDENDQNFRSGPKTDEGEAMKMAKHYVDSSFKNVQIEVSVITTYDFG